MTNMKEYRSAAVSVPLSTELQRHGQPTLNAVHSAFTAYNIIAATLKT